MRQRFLQALQRDAEGVEGEVRGVCNAMLFVYAHNNNEIKESSTGATGKLTAHTHFRRAHLEHSRFLECSIL
uniref:Uncharacterized protein n=1 Tax=Oryza glumipatula TaxID=40148 RepID=A0A0E0B9E9_9ORYZ